MSGAPSRLQYRSHLFTLSMALVVALAYYDIFVNEGFTLGTWLAPPMDWLFMAANVVLLFYRCPRRPSRYRFCC